jgi:hypothetical protein
MGQSTPIEIAGHQYDPETIALMQGVLDEIWAQLTGFQRDQLPRSLIAERLLRAAAAGERGRDALRNHALGNAPSPASSPALSPTLDEKSSPLDAAKSYPDLS